jgi:Mrp family chromosome partitioning ATPase
MTENSIVLAIAKDLFDRGKSVIGVVSCQSGDGATHAIRTVADGLRAYQTDWRILLVDANFAHPSLSEFAEPGTRGWAEQAAEETPPSPSHDITTAQHPRIEILPAVSGAAAPKIHLDQARLSWLRQVLAQARQNFDVVLVDLPPVLQGDAEAQAIAPLLDAVLLVVKAGKTRKPVISRALGILEGADSKPAGMILNQRRMLIPKWIYQRFF